MRAQVVLGDVERQDEADDLVVRSAGDEQDVAATFCSALLLIAMTQRLTRVNS